jgi:hypothetical protein
METSKANEVLELAIQEGHDADIPTNQGAINQHNIQGETHLTTTNLTPVIDKDIEKHREGSVSAASSIPCLDEEKNIGDTSVESNEVWWDGDDDPQNPMNWSSFRKWGAISVVSAITFLTPLASSIFAPGVPMVMEEFHSDSDLLSGFVVSVYVLGFAFGPLGLSCQAFEKYNRANHFSHCSAVRDVRADITLSFM